MADERLSIREQLTGAYDKANPGEATSAPAQERKSLPNIQEAVPVHEHEGAVPVNAQVERKAEKPAAGDLCCHELAAVPPTGAGAFRIEFPRGGFCAGNSFRLRREGLSPANFIC